MDNANGAADLKAFLDSAQQIALKNSTLSSDIADSLTDCRETCANKLKKLFEKDFKSLMNDPVETLALNVTPAVDIEKENAEQAEHNAQLQQLTSQITELQAKRKSYEEERDLYTQMLSQV